MTRVRDQGDAVLMVVLAVLWLPARVVEEGIHTICALPFAETVSVRLNPRAGTAKTIVHYRRDAPEWAISAAYRAPEVVAATAGVAVIAWWLTGGAVWLPSTTFDWLLLAVLGAQYLAIALPSGADRDRTPTETTAEVVNEH